MERVSPRMNIEEELKAVKLELKEKNAQINQLIHAIRKKDIQLMDFLSNGEESELEKLKIEMERRLETILDLKEEMHMSKSEYRNIVDSLMAEVKAKSDELNMTRSVLDGTSNFIRDTKQKENILQGNQSDELKSLRQLNEELSENLKHTRNQNKRYIKQMQLLQLELQKLKEVGEAHYSQRLAPFANQLPENDFSTSMLSTALVPPEKEQQPITSPRQQTTQTQSQTQSQTHPQQPRITSNIPTYVPKPGHSSRIYRPHQSVRGIQIQSEVKIIVNLPSGGIFRCSFDGAQPLEKLKNEVIERRLKGEDPSQYVFGVSKSELFEDETCKILNCHPLFSSSVTNPVEISLFHKPTFSEDDVRTPRQQIQSSPAAMLPVHNPNISHPTSTSTPTPNLPKPITTPGPNIHPLNRSNTPHPNTLKSNTSSPNPNRNSQRPPSDSSNVPIAFLVPEYSQPFIFFIPRNAKASDILRTLTNQLKDALLRLESKQELYSLVGEKRKIQNIKNDDVITNLPFVNFCRRQQKIPVFSLGEPCIINPNAPRDSFRESTRYLSSVALSNNNNNLIKNEQTDSRRARQDSYANKPEGFSTSTTGLYKMNSRRGNQGNENDAIPVVLYLPSGNTVEMNLPRKAKVDTIKKMALQKYDSNENNLYKYYLKVTGTSYFIAEGELSLEDLPIVKFCQKKGLTTMLSLVTKEKSREEKIISKKIGAIVSTALGGPPSAWQIMDNDASDFRIKMSRIIGDKELAYVPAMPVECQPPTDSQLEPTFRVLVHVEDSDSSIGSKTLKVDGNMTSDDVIQLICQKINTSHGTKLDPSQFVLKICGTEIYFDRSVKLDSVVYIRDFRQKKKKIGFTLVAKSKAPNFDLCNYQDVKNYVPFIDTPTVDLYGDKDTISLYELKSNLEIKIISVENIIYKKLGSDYAEISNNSNQNPSVNSSVMFFVRCGFFHGGTIITTSPNDTGYLNTNSVPLINGKATFRQWLRSPIQLCNVPEDSRVCITLYVKKEGSSSSPIANVNCSLFDFKDNFRSGEVTLRMWLEEKEANPIGTCVENLSSPSNKTTKITIGFHSFPHRVAFPNLKPLELIDFSFPQPSKVEIKLLDELINSDPLRNLSNDERALLWKYREYCRCNTKPRSLVKILECVNWTEIDDVRETYRLLLNWDPVSPVDALQLLDAKFANRKVREFAVKCLDSLPDQDLKDYLLQLVQVLKYEPTHFSPLASWLLNRALHNQMLIGHAFFWHLQAELHVPEIAERFALLLELYLRGCGSQRDDLLKQVELIEKLNNIAVDIKSTSSGAKRHAHLQKRLSELELPEKFQLPLDPTKSAKGIVVNKCKSMDSAKAPLWLVFENADPNGDSIWLIFKSGDDLRQDLLTLQMLGIMDKIWKKEGLDLCLTPYKCISTGNGMGMIETVLDSDTTANIQKNFGGVKPLGALMKTPLANWLKERNPGAEYDTAVENFTRSCAGYCVATYVLGIGDRHNDNIMVNKHGFLFHIDFGHFLGNKKKVLNFSRERAPFVLTPEFANVMGCKGSDTFQRFVEFCCVGYNLLRKHANVFINLFAMMLSTGIPELRSEDDIQYLRSSLKIELSDEEARKHFTKMIAESLASMSTQLNFAAHIIAHWK